MLLRAISCGGVWNGFLLGEAKKEDVPCRFCGKRDGDGHLFWECSFLPPLPLQHVRELLEFAFLMSLDRSNWPRCLLWHGCLVSRVLVKENLGPSLLLIWPLFILRGVSYPVDFGNAWTPPDHWDVADIALEMPDHPDVWTDGSREDFSSLGGFEVAGAVVYLPTSEIAFDNSVWSTVEENGDARLERFRAFPGVFFLPCRHTGLVIWVLTTLMSFVALVVCLMLIAWLSLSLWLKMVIWLLLSNT